MDRAASPEKFTLIDRSHFGSTAAAAPGSHVGSTAALHREVTLARPLRLRPKLLWIDRCGFAAGCEARLCLAVRPEYSNGLRPRFGLGPDCTSHIRTST